MRFPGPSRYFRCSSKLSFYIESIGKRVAAMGSNPPAIRTAIRKTSADRRADGERENIQSGFAATNSTEPATAQVNPGRMGFEWHDASLVFIVHRTKNVRFGSHAASRSLGSASSQTTRRALQSMVGAFAAIRPSIRLTHGQTNAHPHVASR